MKSAQNVIAESYVKYFLSVQKKTCTEQKIEREHCSNNIFLLKTLQDIISISFKRETAMEGYKLKFLLCSPFHVFQTQLLTIKPHDHNISFKYIQRSYISYVTYMDHNISFKYIQLDIIELRTSNSLFVPSTPTSDQLQKCLLEKAKNQCNSLKG